MNMFNNLSSLQRNFIRNCFIFLGVIAWLVFGFVSVANEWGLCCVIFSARSFSWPCSLLPWVSISLSFAYASSGRLWAY